MSSAGGYFSQREVATLGCAAVGDNVLIHRSVILVNPAALTLENNIRIDAFTVITCGKAACRIGNHVHISTHVFIAGRAGFDLGDYSGLASGARLFTTSDDFSGNFLTGPTLAETQTNAAHQRITIGEHAVAGANSIVMPGGSLGEGAILGALSLTKCPLDPWTQYGGAPARRIKPRSKALLALLQDRNPD